MLDLTPHFITFPVLETERLRMREVTTADTQAMFDFMSIPEVNQYLGRPPMTRMEQAEKRIDTYISTFTRQDGYGWVLNRREDGAFVGTAILYHLDPAHHRAEVGYTIRPEFWNRGFATEALRAMVDLAFGTMGLHSLKLQTDPDNAGSRRVAEKLGFVQEGHFREDYYFAHEDKWGDTVQFGLLAREWAGRG